MRFSGQPKGVKSLGIRRGNRSIQTNPSMSDEIKQAGWLDIFLWMMRRRHRFRITGLSMVPILQPGEIVLVDDRAYVSRIPQQGDIVVAWHPFEKEVRVVKRIRWVSDDHHCFLEGINQAESTDSRSWGMVALTMIVGQVICRFR